MSYLERSELSEICNHLQRVNSFDPAVGRQNHPPDVLAYPHAHLNIDALDIQTRIDQPGYQLPRVLPVLLRQLGRL